MDAMMVLDSIQWDMTRNRSARSSGMTLISSGEPPAQCAVRFNTNRALFLYSRIIVEKQILHFFPQFGYIVDHDYKIMLFPLDVSYEAF